jgi:fermentation-respiration switch protein FrsA (DUF1100 family)
VGATDDFSVERSPATGGAEDICLHTKSGGITCRLHSATHGNAAVLWVFGAGGGLDGPAGGMYTRLAEYLLPEGISSLRLDYRQPGLLNPCILDVLVGISYLQTLERSRVILAGHSFGGAVVINAGAHSPAVTAVAALSSQSFATESVSELSPRPLLLMHGTADEVLPDTCSRDIYHRARDPKQLLLYQGCRHGLDDCRDEVDRDLMRWIREVTGSSSMHADL